MEKRQMTAPELVAERKRQGVADDEWEFILAAADKSSRPTLEFIQEVLMADAGQSAVVQ